MQKISICDKITKITTKEEAMNLAIMLCYNCERTGKQHVLFGLLGAFVEPIILNDEELDFIIDQCGSQMIYCYHA